jgi:hypothetical protein
MGKFNSKNDNGVYQLIQGALAHGVWAAPAYFNNSVYYGAESDNLKEFAIVDAKFPISASSASANAFAYPGTTPSVSANGTSGGIVWAVENSGGAGILHSYDATNLANELYNSNQAANGRDHFADNKFVTPMIAHGKVYVGTPTGVIVFGLLSGSNQTATPTINPASGTVSPTQAITISDATSGATIYYTTNGATPTITSSEKYTGPFTLSTSSTVEAIAAANGLSSSVASGTFTVSQQAASPTFSPNGGTVSSTQAITIADAISGATIYYTTDGSTPTPRSGTTKQYSAPFTLSASASVRAIATANGYSNSSVSSASFTLQSSSSTSTQSTAISIDFVGLNTTPMSGSELAGVVPLSHWNDAAKASSSSPLALVDQNGNPTTATVTWTADDVWDQPITDQPGNARMMKGYLDNGQMDTTTVTISGLPASANGYSVYIYAQGAANNSSNTGIYQISGSGVSTASAALTYNSTFNGTFTQATASNPIGNYVVLTIPNVSAFTLSAIPSTSSNSYKRAPINAIQIVPVSSPDFTISVAPTSRSVTTTGSTSYVASIGALNGFTGMVNLNVNSGLPTGTTASFSPTSVAPGTSSTLSVTTSASTPTGSSTVSITGTSGSLTHSDNVTLNVSTSTSSSSVSALSIDFVGLYTTPMGSSELAGVVPLSHWNDAAKPSSSSPLALLDQNGNPTTATVTWIADDVWDQPITDQPGNARMMKGYLDNAGMSTTKVTVSGLPANTNGYSVYVYAQGAANNSSNTGIYQISGSGFTITGTLTYISTFNGTFTQATASNPIGNYVVLAIPNVSTFTLSAIPSTSSNSYKRAPINAIQIVPR